MFKLEEKVQYTKKYYKPEGYLFLESTFDILTLCFSIKFKT